MKTLLIAVAMMALLPVSSKAVPLCPDRQLADGEVTHLLEDGNAAYEAGDRNQANALWSRIRACASTSTDWPKAVYNLGLLEQEHGNHRQAIDYFQQVIESQPNDREPGASIMVTNRNYSNHSAMAISQCYEAMGRFAPALRYAWLAKAQYRYYSWCGTCLAGANRAMNVRIAYLSVRASRIHLWGFPLVVGAIVVRRRNKKSLREV